MRKYVFSSLFKTMLALAIGLSFFSCAIIPEFEDVYPECQEPFLPGQVECYEYPDPAPKGGEIMTDIIRARLSHSFFEFFTSHISEIIASNLPTYEDPDTGRTKAVYYLPGVANDECGTSPQSNWIGLRDGCACDNSAESKSYCYHTETFRSRMEFDLTDVDSSINFDFTDTNPVTLTISIQDVDIYGELALVYFVDYLFLDDSGVCYVRGETDNNGDQRPLFRVHNIEVSIEIDVINGHYGKILNVEVSGGDLDFGKLFSSNDDAVNIKISPCTESATNGACVDNACSSWGCNAVCNITNALFSVGEVLIDIFTPVLNTFGDDILKWIGDAITKELDEIPVQLQAGLDISQMFTEDLPVASIMPNATVLGMNYLPNGTPIRINGTGSAQGLSFVYDGGMAADVKSDCVADFQEPDYGLLHPDIPDFNGSISLQDEDGQAHLIKYDAVFSLSEAALAQVAYGILRSGALCISMDSFQLQLLAGDTFIPTAGLFSTIASEIAVLADQDAPVLITLHPTQIPEFEVGGDLYSPQDPQNTESTLTMTMENLDLSFFLFTEDRYARMFTVLTDISIALSLTPTIDNELQLTIDKINIDNFEQTFNDLAPHAVLDELIQTIMDIALGSVLTEQITLKIELAQLLSDTLGTDLTIAYNYIGLVKDPNSYVDRGHLGIFVTFCDEEDLQDESHYACYSVNPDVPDATPSITLSDNTQSLEKLTESIPIYEFSQVAKPTGKAVLSVTHGYEYGYRIDGGPWYSYKKPALDGTFTINNGRLVLPGWHTIELRYRPEHYTHILPVEPVVLKLLVDGTAPHLTTSITDTVLTYQAQDIGTPIDELTYQCCAQKMHGKPTWFPLPAGQEQCQQQAKILKTNKILVRAVDLAGNTSNIETVDTSIVKQLQAYNPDSTIANGCNASKPGTWWFLFGLFALLYLKPFKSSLKKYHT